MPKRGYIEIYNISGQHVHKQRAYYGHNDVDMSGMVAGTYLLRVVDLGALSTSGVGGSAASTYLVKEKKVVKVP